MKYSSLYMNIPNLSYQVSSLNYSNHYYPIPNTNIKNSFSPHSHFENKKIYEYSIFNNNISDSHRNINRERKFHKNYSAENIMNHNYNYLKKKKRFSSQEIMNMKISFDLLKNKISQLKQLISQDNLNLINYKHNAFLPQKEYRNNYRKSHYKSMTNINSSILKKNSTNNINTKLNLNTNFSNENLFDKYILPNNFIKSNKQFSVCPYINNYILNNYKSINNQLDSNINYNEIVNNYNSKKLENSIEKQDTEELNDLASDLLNAFNIDNHIENDNNIMNNMNQNNLNSNITQSKNIKTFQKFKNLNQIDLKSKNNYSKSNTKIDTNIELKNNNNNNNFKNNNNNNNYDSLENIKYNSERSFQNKNIKVLRKKEKSFLKDSEEDKLLEYNILSHNSRINSPISSNNEIEKEKSKSIINKIQDIFNEYEKDEDYINKNIEQNNKENQNDNKKIENEQNKNTLNFNTYEEENESEIFAEIVEKAKEISQKVDSKNNNHSKNVSFSEDKTILIKYKENEQITKLNIYDNNEKKIKFTPIKINNYLNNLKKPFEKKSIITNSPLLDIETIKKKTNEKIFKNNKLRRNLSDININKQLNEKYKIIHKKENINKDNKKNEMSPIINRNINLIKIIESYNKKGLKYHPKNKKEKEHKIESIHICDKIIKDPQKFFTVKVFDNLLKSYNIKGIENNDNKKNKNEKCIKKIDNKNTNKKDDFKKTFLKIKEYFVEENSYINDE